MKDTVTGFSYNLADLSGTEWLERVDEITEDFGHAEPIGPDYSALLIDAGPTLFVSFESMPRIIEGNDNSAPMGWGFVQSHDWSSLTLLAESETDWFRHPALFGYFDRLIDDGFFDDFDQILFYGAGAAGYAAAVYSIAAPDAQVLVIQPQATLAPDLTRWDRRFPQARRLDFSSRFGYAPTMVETAENVWVVHDPKVIEDAMHAQMFDGPNTTHFTCPYLGSKADRALQRMDVLPELLDEAMAGTLDPATYAELWHTRRSHLPYLRGLLHRLDGNERHERMMARFCRKILAKRSRPYFAKKLAELEDRGVAV